jgi:hypothetical protein
LHRPSPSAKGALGGYSEYHLVTYRNAECLPRTLVHPDLRLVLSVSATKNHKSAPARGFDGQLADLPIADLFALGIDSEFIANSDNIPKNVGSIGLHNRQLD